MDKIVNISYAAVYAVAQAIATFAQIRADQVALSTLSDSQNDQTHKKGPDRVCSGARGEDKIK